MRVEHKFGGDALVEFGVALWGVFQADCCCIDDLRNRQAAVQQRHHELAIVAQDGVWPVWKEFDWTAKAQAKTEVAGFGGLVVGAGIFGDIQSRYADGPRRPDDLP